jgi:hypothetical protein
MGLFSGTINNIISHALLLTGSREVDWRRLRESRLHLRWWSFTSPWQINSTCLVSRAPISLGIDILSAWTIHRAALEIFLHSSA